MKIDALASVVALLLYLDPLTNGADSLPESRIPSGFGSATGQQWEVVPEYSYDDPTIPAGAYRKITGLFVGVGKYKSLKPDLPNPPNDARDLSHAFEMRCGLKQGDYEVLINEDATLPKIQEALRRLARDSGKGDLFIFHFSGHGIGLENKTLGQKSGRMLLYETPNLEGVIKGEGTLSMEHLNFLVRECGIQSKHQLYLFDCCYSGMGATGRARAISSGDTRHQMEENLKRKASFLITAGGKDQPVLDGPNSNGRGNGLLTAKLIDCLQQPEMFGLDKQVVPCHGADYLDVRDLFRVIEDQVPAAASELIRSAVDSVEAEAERAFPTRTANAPRLNVRTLKDFRPQRPQDDRSEGEGRVYLPLRLGTPSATVSSSDGVAASPPPLLPPDYERWVRQVGTKYSRSDYQEVLAKLFALLLTGAPPRQSASKLMEIEAELRIRPSYSPEEAVRVTGLHNTEQALLRMQEIRGRAPGADWKALPREGGVISDEYEYRFFLNNHGAAPLFYYVVALDQSGILQWLAPKNNSSDAEITFGKSPLPPGRSLAIPEDALVSGSLLTRGWSVIHQLDQQFILVALRSEWPEFRGLLTRASSIAAQLCNSREATVPLGSLLPREFARSRQVGPPGRSPAIVLGPAQQGKEYAPPIVTRFDGDLLVSGWNVHVVPANQLKAVVRPLNRGLP
jgi:hypothetical protein